MVKDAGFTNIDWRIIKRPTNDWPRDPRMKEIGAVYYPRLRRCEDVLI